MAELVYEFESVKDKEGNNKINKEYHANPVFVVFLKEGRSGVFAYIDKPEKSFITSKVEYFCVVHNNLKIITENTEYWLKPYIRKGN